MIRLNLLMLAIASAITAPAMAQDTVVPTAQAATGSTPAISKHKAPEGVDLTLDFVGNLAGNPVGGVEQGVEGSYWVMGQAKFDLGTLWGWEGWSLDTQAAWFAGRNLAREKIGNSISAQQTWRPVAGGRLTRFTLTKKFGNGLSLTAGRTALNSYFNSSPLNCVFMSNAMCLTPYGPITDIGITAYPNSSWAAIARYDVNDRVYVQAGAFDYNNDLNLAGKNGVDFSWRDGSGTLSAGEVGYETKFSNDRLPRRYRLGVYRNTDGGRNPYYDASGNSAALTGKATAAQDGDRVGWYAMGDQTLLRGKGQRNLAVFGRYYINTGNAAQIKWFASAGLVKTGTFAGRDKDTLAMFVSDTHFDPLEMAYLRDVRQRAGGIGSPHNDEVVGEISYGIALGSGVRLMPNLQYIINPDPIYAPTRTTDIPDAVVIGLRLDVHFADLFGW